MLISDPKVAAAIFTTPGVKGAFFSLTEQVSTAHATKLLQGFETYLRSVSTSPPLSTESLWMGAQAALVVALLHCAMGTPLHLTDDLLDLWSEVDGTVAECERCGYRHPAGISACVVCGGLTGPGGVWAKRRAHLAILN